MAVPALCHCYGYMLLLVCYYCVRDVTVGDRTDWGQGFCRHVYEGDSVTCVIFRCCGEVKCMLLP
jgi:hypothetical protein